MESHNPTGRHGPIPVDFMQDPDWTPLATEVMHATISADELGRLPRRDRDYAYRLVAHPDSPVSVEQTLRWYAQVPSGVTAGLVGAAKVRQARRIRGTRLVTQLDAEEAERYTAILADADSFLLNACAKYPTSVLPWVPRIDAARGLRLGIEEVERRYREAHTREPLSYLAAEEAVIGHCAMWSGSYEEAFRFAVEAANSPDGHPLSGLVAVAEAERVWRDFHTDLDLMPSRRRINFEREFIAYVRACHRPLEPDDVIAMGAFVAVIEPTTEQLAEHMREALQLLARRCGGHPFTMLSDPLGHFRQLIEVREKQIAALIGD